jgi:hypothetical protein
MGRRSKRDDVFLIGAESLADQTEELATPEQAPTAGQEPGDAPSPGLGPRTEGRGRPRRRVLLAIAPIAAGLLALASTELIGSGSGGHREPPKTSARPDLLQAPSAAMRKAPPASPRRADHPGHPRQHRGSEDDGLGREPAPTTTAPQSPPPLAVPVAEASPDPVPPSPSPPSSGGGPAGTDDFGFER